MRGAHLLDHLRHPLTPSQLWGIVRRSSADWSFDDFVLTLDMLFALGSLEFSRGVLTRRVA